MKNYLIQKHCTVRIVSWKHSEEWRLGICVTPPWSSPGRRCHSHFPLSLCHCPGQYKTEQGHRIGAIRTQVWFLAIPSTTVGSYHSQSLGCFGEPHTWYLAKSRWSKKKKVPFISLQRIEYSPATSYAFCHFYWIQIESKDHSCLSSRI